MYGTNVGKYNIGTYVYYFCILGFILIPLEIFLKDIVTNRIENDLIIKMQSSINSTKLEYLANTMLNISDVNVLRYVVYLLYLGGDAILATKTAILAFYGQFILVMLKIAYKEPRPYWVNSQIQGKRCE